MGLGPEAVPSTCVSVFTQDRSDVETWRFAGDRGWRRLVRRLKPIEEAHLERIPEDGCYQPTLEFSTTQQYKHGWRRLASLRCRIFVPRGNGLNVARRGPDARASATPIFRGPNRS